MREGEGMVGFEIALEAHYASMTRAGYAGRCRMDLPDDLAGKRVLDLMCRSGKGAFKIAEQAGADGFVLGVDPDAARVEQARVLAPDGRCGRAPAFERGFPEELRMAGAEDASFDVVVANSALNTTWDLDAALREIARVLVPGGFLYHAGLFSCAPLAQADARRFAAQGNVFGAAGALREFERRAFQAGFSACICKEVERAAPEGREAVPELAGVLFEAVVLQGIA